MAAADARSSFGRSAGLLSAGVGTAGVITYVYFSLASHNLPATEYGEIVVAWSAVFVTISVLQRPVEQFLSRAIAARRARGAEIGSALRAAAAFQAAIMVAFAGCALALRGPLEDGLFSGSESLYWIYVGAVLAFAVGFFARGYLAGEGRFAILAGLIIAESLARAAFALAVAIGIADGQTAVALGIVAAPCLSLLVIPLAFGRWAAAEAPPPRSAPDEESESATTLTRGSAFAAAVFAIMLSEQALLNAGPLLLRAFEGAAAAGFIFNVLMLARAPLVVFQGVAISLLPHLTRVLSRGDRDGAFAGSVGGTLRAVAAFTVVVLAIVAAAGPELMQLAFGDEFTYDRVGLLLVAGGMGFYLAATTLNQAALADGQARRAAGCWVACGAGFVGWSLLPILDADRRIEVGFALAALALFALLWRVYRAPHPRPEDVPAPGSPAELEARLALADEAS
jgi:O-antigen/teichoic acid export membrane protein